MNVIVTLLIGLFICASCTDYFNRIESEKKDSTFTGYVVEKEYSCAHRRDSAIEKQITTAGVPMAPIIIAAKRGQERREAYNAEIIPSHWILVIANRNKTIEYESDSVQFDSIRCGEKITVKIK